MLFWGALAVVTTTIGLGAFWPNFRAMEAPDKLLHLIGTSLYSAWLLSIFLYFVDLGTAFDRLVLIVLAGASIYLWCKPYFKIPIVVGILVPALYIVIAYIVYTQPDIDRNYYAERWTPIFQWSDSVTSWNNWAIELANGNFSPFDNFYPVGWPGIWSLIYRAQDNSQFWLFAKQSLVVLHICLLLMIISITRLGNILVTIAYSAFVVSFFLIAEHWTVLNGYMDTPVAILIFASLSLSMLFLHSDQPDDRWSLLGAVVFAGLASVTKQSGLLTLVLMLCILLLARKKMIFSWLQTGRLAFLTVLPVAVFSTLYFSSTVPERMTSREELTPEIFGLLNTLKTLSQSRVTDETSQLVNSYGQLDHLFIPLSVVRVFGSDFSLT